MRISMIERLEADLRHAMLTGDVAAIDALLADDLIFTDQKGMTLSKAADLEAHRSGVLKLTSIESSDQRIRLMTNAAIVVVRSDLAGRYAGQLFNGSFVYTRVWLVSGDRGQVVVGHCCAIA
jgi:ketosteroid isomerase-like protein